MDAMCAKFGFNQMVKQPYPNLSMTSNAKYFLLSI